MPAWNDLFAVFVLFWPAAIGVSFLAFMTVAIVIFFIGGAILIFSIFLYGAYALLRDTGGLTWIFEKLFTLKQHITEHVDKHIRASFLIENVAKHLQEGPCLFVGHPHGLYAVSWFIHFSLGTTDWPLDAERPVLAVHSLFFKIPLVRELFLQHRCIEATEDNILKILQQGQSVVLLVGGIEELSHTEPGPIKLILKKRNGYIRIAKQASVPLVPLLSLGENELFPASKHWLWSKFQRWIYDSYHIALPLPTWKSLNTWASLMYKPLDTPCKTYILDAVNDTSRKSQKEIRDEYIHTLMAFAEEQQQTISILA